MSLDSANAQDILTKSQEDPIWWVESVLGDKLWSKQEEILLSVRDNIETTVRSAHSTGKSFIAARCALWFGCSFPNSTVISTAPTEKQVTGIIWKEIRTAHANALIPIGGQLLQKELRFNAEWRLFGFTAPAYDSDKFQGFHSSHILVIADEAAGISPEIFDAIDSILSSGHGRLLMIGNPTDPSSEFARSFKRIGPNKIKISAYDTPNFTEFGITEHNIAANTWQQKIGDKELPAPHLISPTWVAKRYQLGPESPFYLSRVLANFPEASRHTLIPLRWLEAAQERTIEVNEEDEVHLGVDVARFGGDKTIISQKIGPVGRILYEYQGLNTMETSGMVARAIAETNATVAKVDVIGIGAGVVDRLLELNLPVLEGCASAKAMDYEKFLNARAEWYWHLRTLLEAGDIDLDLEDEVLIEQLASLQYKVNSKGQIVIESKEEMKKRGLPSPDRADALVYAFAPIGENELAIIY